MITASCHCGAVCIELSELTATITQCNCSLCRRYAALWAYLTPRTAHVLTPSDVESHYSWNDKVVEFYFCNTCGCLTRYEDVEKSATSRIAVNARMLATEDIADIKIRKFDGAKM